MAQQVHFAKATLKALDLSKAGSGIEVTVHYDGSNSDFYDDEDPARTKIGTLKIGYGGLYWKGGRKQKAKRLSWSDLAYFMKLRR
jgi:hypothetical protein